MTKSVSTGLATFVGSVIGTSLFCLGTKKTLVETVLVVGVASTISAIVVGLSIKAVEEIAKRN